MNDLPSLLKLHQDFIARIKAQGGKTLTYKVPCCGGIMEDRAAQPGETWDTLSTCPHCGGLYMKIITSEKIEGVLPEAS